MSMEMRKRYERDREGEKREERESKQLILYKGITQNRLARKEKGQQEPLVRGAVQRADVV
jgi:hypothetical protein